MGWYDRRILPKLIDLAMADKPIARCRQVVVPQAEGEVLEIGFGTGRNLLHYKPKQVKKLWALEPAADVRAIGEVALGENSPGFEIEIVDAGIASIPLPDKSVDNVVMTYTLCSVGASLADGLSEIRRVLRPRGRLLFSEHGLAPQADMSVQNWQKRITPLWQHIAGGCRLDIDVPANLKEHGFKLEYLRQGYLPGWRPLRYNSLGMYRSA